MSYALNNENYNFTVEDFWFSISTVFNKYGIVEYILSKNNLSFDAYIKFDIKFDVVTTKIFDIRPFSNQGSGTFSTCTTDLDKKKY